MRKHWFAIIGSLALTGLPQVAGAQDEPPPAAPPPAAIAPPPPDVCPPGTSPAYRTVAPAPPVSTAPAFAPHQLALSSGGGVANFVRDRITDGTTVGGAWDVRFQAGTRSFLGFEADYTGTSQGIDGTLNGEGGSIVTTQLAGSLRFNMTRARVQPFLTAGGGWINLHRYGSGDTAALTINKNDNAFVAPFGGGIAAYVGRHGMIDARANYNLVASKDFTDSGARPDMWNAELRLGYAF